MARPDDLSGLVAELTALGYPRPQPPSLGQPRAFDWVADCLLWLCARAAPGLALPQPDYSSEAARVAFLSSLGAAFYQRASIRLNLRRLYRAGGSAAHELHKLAAALRTAGEAVAASPPQLPSPAAPQRVRKQLEGELGAARQQAGQLEAEVMAAGQEVAVMEGRVEKRHVELDRLERRLDSLQAIKPAHSGEVEALEAELSGLYQQYLHKFRNLEYLEGVLDKYAAARQAEAEEADRQLRRIQRQVAAEELRLLQGSADLSGPAALAAMGSMDSDSEEELLGGGAGGGILKALPKLAGLGGLGSSAGLGGSMGGGGMAAAAAALDLLPEDEESGASMGGNAGSVGAGGRSRLSMGSSAGGPDAAEGGGGGGGRVTFGQAAIINGHQSGGGSGGGAPRPSSARRTTGSANALIRKASGGVAGGAGSDVLILSGSDNDF